MVEVPNFLQPLPQRHLWIVPLDFVKEIGKAASSSAAQVLLDQLRSDLLGGEIEDRAVLVLGLLVGLIDYVKDRMCVQVGGKYILPVFGLQNPGPMSGLHNGFDRGILQAADRARDPGPGLEVVRDQVNIISNFHAFLTVAEARGGEPGMFDAHSSKKFAMISPVVANFDLLQAVLGLGVARHVGALQNCRRHYKHGA
jgi:hypothetical protein